MVVVQDSLSTSSSLSLSLLARRNVWNVPSAFRLAGSFPSCISSYTYPSPNPRIHFRRVLLARERKRRLEEGEGADSFLQDRRNPRNHWLKRIGERGPFIVHVQGLIFRPNARYSEASGQSLYGETFGKCIAATMPGTERETRILVTKTRMNLSLSLSILFSLRASSFKGFRSFRV